VEESGDPSAPTVVLVHGYPDTSAVWDAVAAVLAEDHHVVTYDVRGMGRSSEPTGPNPYDLRHLADDLYAVAAATGGGQPVHVVGHDWGSIQAWEAVVDGDRNAALASFTTLSGPCLDHVAVQLRSTLRHPRPRPLARLLRQGLRSGYIGFFRLPVLPTALWRRGGDRAWRRFLARAEGVAVDERHPAPTLATDGERGVELYRANVARRLRRPAARATAVPVQLVVLERDAYVTPVLVADLEQWTFGLQRRSLDAGHWAPRTHPEQVAALVAEHVARVEAAQPASAKPL
jgi:pimeloyl-ACP methyl ester carboxylesterase